MVKVAGTKQRLAFLMGVATDVGESCSDGAKGGLALRISTVVQWIIQQLVGCKTTGEKTGMVPKKCQFPFVYDSVGILKERRGFPCSFHLIFVLLFLPAQVPQDVHLLHLLQQRPPLVQHRQRRKGAFRPKRKGTDVGLLRRELR